MKLSKEYLDHIRLDNKRHTNDYTQPVFLKDLLGHIACLDTEIKTLENDYDGCVGKFDDCRAMLAFMVERKGISVTPPDDYKGAWHEYLIEQLP